MPDGINDSMDVNLSELRELVLDREAWCAVIHGVVKSHTGLSTFTKYINLLSRFKMIKLIKTQHIKDISSVQFSRSIMSDSLQPHESQHTSPPCSSPAPGVYPNSCPSSR